MSDAMPIKIRLQGGATLIVEASLSDWSKAFSKALRTNSMLEIVTDDEHVLGINPSQILYLEAKQDES